MDKAQKERLARLITQAMQEKKLGVRDVERLSKKKISNTYVSGIKNARVANLSVEKIRALDKVLDVDGHEIFEAAYGPRRTSKDESSRLDRSDLVFILELIQKTVASPGLLALLEELVHLSPEDHVVLLKTAKKLNAIHATSHRKKSPV